MPGSIVTFTRFHLRAHLSCRWQQHVEDTLFSMVFRAGSHLLGFLFAGLLDGGFHQIANDGIHIAPDITHLSEFGRFHLDEWCIGEFRETACDFGLADSGRANHQDIFWRDFLP